jgi:hypothetical protein
MNKPLIIALLIFVGAISTNAQQLFLLKNKQNNTIPQLYQQPQIASDYNSIVIDYDSADARAYNNQYSRLMWPMNMRYATNDTAPNFCMVAYDSLYDVYADTAYISDSVTSLGLDSIHLFIGHENNSGQNDTLITKIVSLNADGYPQINNVLWSFMKIITANNPLSGNWQQPVVLSHTPYASITGNGFAVVIEYYGSTLDTLGIIAGFGHTDSCGTSAYNADTTNFSRIRMQIGSNRFKANSFAKWSHLTQFGTLPTPNGANVFYDCNNNSQYDPGSDGESFLQNIKLIAFLQTNSASINDFNNALELTNVYPSPASSVISLKYNGNDCIKYTYQITDITGRELLTGNNSFCLTEKTLTLDVNSLTDGVYFITIISVKGKSTKKFAISK